MVRLFLENCNLIVVKSIGEMFYFLDFFLRLNYLNKIY